MIKEKSSNIADLLGEFAKNSSSPSLSRVSTARGITEKIFWMCIGITATVGAAYHLYTIICTYMQHNYYTSITNDFEEPLEVSTIFTTFIVLCCYNLHIIKTLSWTLLVLFSTSYFKFMWKKLFPEIIIRYLINFPFLKLWQLSAQRSHPWGYSISWT